MNRRRVGEDRRSKEMDGCPLTGKCIQHWTNENANVRSVAQFTKHDKF
jgi:hypothetical protein